MESAIATTDPIVYLDIVEKVASFYENAWFKLIYLISAAVAVVGVVIPLVLQFWQRQQLRIAESKIKADAIQSMAEEFKKTEEYLTRLLDEKIKSVSDELSKKIMVIDAGIFHSQALIAVSKNATDEAVRSAIAAAKMYFLGDDCRNAGRALNILNADCLPKINKKTFEQQEDLEDKFKELINVMSEKNINGQYTDQIEQLKKRIKDSKLRDAQPR